MCVCVYDLKMPGGRRGKQHKKGSSKKSGQQKGKRAHDELSQNQSQQHQQQGQQDGQYLNGVNGNHGYDGQNQGMDSQGRVEHAAEFWETLGPEERERTLSVALEDLTRELDAAAAQEEARVARASPQLPNDDILKDWETYFLGPDLTTGGLSM